MVYAYFLTGCFTISIRKVSNENLQKSFEFWS